MATNSYEGELILGSWEQLVVDVTIDYDYYPGQDSIYTDGWESSIPGTAPEIVFRGIYVHSISTPLKITRGWLLAHPGWHAFLIDKLTDLVLDAIEEENDLWQRLVYLGTPNV